MGFSFVITIIIIFWCRYSKVDFVEKMRLNISEVGIFLTTHASDLIGFSLLLVTLNN